MAERALFLDADGVLADFDTGVRRLLKMSPDDFVARHGKSAFWKRLSAAQDFYTNLPEMPDARILFKAVEHLRPTILTGLPVGSWAGPQKIAWAANHFPNVPVTTCMARDKHKHMNPGDVLVDDRDTHCAAYQSAGILFVHHKDAKESLNQLATIFPSIAME